MERDLGLPERSLQETIARYNEFAATGEDLPRRVTVRAKRWEPLTRDVPEPSDRTSAQERSLKFVKTLRLALEDLLDEIAQANTFDRGGLAENLELIP